MTENRNGLAVETGFTHATGTAEREEAEEMIERHSTGPTRRLTVGADKGYDTTDSATDLRAMSAYDLVGLPRLLSAQTS
jgi:hypothetical protein